MISAVLIENMFSLEWTVGEIACQEISRARYRRSSIQLRLISNTLSFTQLRQENFLKPLNKFICTVLSLPICLASSATFAQESDRSIALQFPVNCTLDQDCFLQQFTDMDGSPDIIDPFCSSTTYNGHKGTDIRLRTLKDIDKNIEVVAAAAGTVKGVRKNQPDKIVESDADRQAIEGVECGNGVVIDHGNTIETQYCHLKQFSPQVKSGDVVKAGDVIGYVGSSGLAQFPHLHISVRKDGNIFDPFTGRLQSQGCTAETDKSWWKDKSVLTAKRDRNLLDSNLTGAPTKHNALKRQAPPRARTSDAATVGWVWYSNLKAGDRIFIKLKGPNGFAAQNLSDPLDRNKASWSGFVGKKRKPQIRRL